MQHDSPNGAVTYCTSRKFQVYIRISNLHVIMIYRDIDVMPIVICDMKKFHIVAALLHSSFIELYLNCTVLHNVPVLTSENVPKVLSSDSHSLINE